MEPILKYATQLRPEDVFGLIKRAIELETKKLLKDRELTLDDVSIESKPTLTIQENGNLLISGNIYENQ